MMRRTLPALFLVCGLICCLGCGMSDGFAAGKAAVTEFHSRMDAEQYDAIYDAADPLFRQSLTRDDIHKFFARLHKKFGKFNDSNTKGMHYNVTTDGTFVNINCTTNYSSGKVDEEFQWKMTGGKALLLKYNANSPLLLTD
jgi:hypothetical protein